MAKIVSQPNNLHIPAPVLQGLAMGSPGAQFCSDDLSFQGFGRNTSELLYAKNHQTSIFVRRKKDGSDILSSCTPAIRGLARLLTQVGTELPREPDDHRRSAVRKGLRPRTRGGDTKVT